MIAGAGHASGMSRTQTPGSALGAIDFMQILVAQLRHQDPLSPMEDKEFVTQLAQFSMLDGITAMNAGFSRMEGLGLLGRQVLAVRSDTKEAISGTVEAAHFDNGQMRLFVDGQPVSLTEVVWIGTQGAQPPAAAQTDSELSPEGLEKAAQIVEMALQFLGAPYVYGAESPADGFDCTGFTQYLYKQFGISLARTAQGQGYNTPGTRIHDVRDLRIGDLVYMNTVPDDEDLSDHAGIYIGDGQFIHASSSMGRVVISDIDSGYYNRVFSWGIRVFE
jgi:cell wall-associated NlpC family hydrolase